MNNNCIFCKIIGDEILSNKVYEDEYFVGILDISPANKGHIVVLPKKHMDNIFELDEEYGTRLMMVVKNIATAVKSELNCEGMNILQNNGEVAGQTVNHYHMHIIPRGTVDGVKISWEHKGYEGQEAAELATAIQRRL